MKYLIALLLLSVSALAQNNTGTLVIAPIRPQASNDTFPSAIANEIKGGPFSVATTTAMSNIPSERLVVGSLAYVTNDNSFRIYNGTNWSQSGVRDSIGLGWSALTNTNAATSLLGFDFGGTIIANTGINVLTFTNRVNFDNGNLWLLNGSVIGNAATLDVSNAELLDGEQNIIFSFTTNAVNFSAPISFATGIGATTRANLGFSTNLNTLWAATNASNARSAIGIGDTNAVAFSGIYNNGNFTNINGTIYGLKTNVGPFEGIGNFFASNNTTLSNETLFRVGLAEITNKSAQFGFRVTRTNNGGEGVAVYSIFGYNALMMIGPSDRSRINYATNTNAGVEATLWTITPTNQVMTLRDTNTGATTLHQSLGFDTNVTSTAPTNTTNIVKWIEVWVGTNSYRMPLYQ